MKLKLPEIHLPTVDVRGKVDTALNNPQNTAVGIFFLFSLIYLSYQMYETSKSIESKVTSKGISTAAALTIQPPDMTPTPQSGGDTLSCLPYQGLTTSPVDLYMQLGQDATTALYGPHVVREPLADGTFYNHSVIGSSDPIYNRLKKGFEVCVVYKQPEKSKPVHLGGR